MNNLTKNTGTNQIYNNSFDKLNVKSYFNIIDPIIDKDDTEYLISNNFKLFDFFFVTAVKKI